jgi:hypothetical protein
LYHRRPCCWQVSLEHLWLFGSPFFASPPPSSTEVIYRTLVGQHRFQPQGLHLMQHIFGSSLCFTSHCLPVCVGEHHLCTQGRSRRTLGRRWLHGCRLCKAGGGRQALFASPLIVSQCVLVSTTCAHKAEAGEHLEEEGSMAAAFARPVGEGKRTPIGFRSRSWNFRILRGAPLAQKQKGNASVCRQPRHANRGGDAKQQVSWRPGTFREPVGSSRRVATEESNGRKHTFSIPVFHCKPLWPQATPTNAPEKKTRLSTSRYGFRCLAFN